MSADSAVSIAWDVFKIVFVPIKHQFEYVMCSKRYADGLRKEVGNLEYEVARVRNAKEVARNNRQNTYAWVPEFLANAEKALKEAGDLLGEFDKASKTCCYGTLPDPHCRYQFSREAKHRTDSIKNLILDNRGKDISFSGPAPGDVAAPTLAWREGKDVIQSTTATASASSASTSIKPRDDGVFESRALTMQKVMDALANTSNSVVGIYGIGGVGKSTLLLEVEKRIREERSFHLVAKANVSENPDIKRIQGEIAHCLGFSELEKKEYPTPRADLLRKRLEEGTKEENDEAVRLEDENDEAVRLEDENDEAERLEDEGRTKEENDEAERLEDEGRTKEENDEEMKKSKKKVLIILDNLWERLDLDKVGIPCGLDNKPIGCKLLLTSRYENVLRREMRCEQDSAFPLGVLKEEEAERLFQTMVGGKVPVELEPLVEEALRICAGFPFLIVAVAKLFINTSYDACKYDLKRIWNEDEDTGEKINQTLRVSYERLKPDAKRLLKLIAVYGVSKPSLENLVRYGVGLGLFGEESSMEDARSRLKSLIETLRDSSLLLPSEEDASGFKIHDLVRQFVASIISRDHPLLVLKDESDAKLTTNKLRSCRAICFPYVDMKKLPEELDCPQLHTFLLFEYNKSLKISDSYFNSMKNLMALHLTGICLSRSLSPFQFLEKLHSLCLDYCSLEDVAILGELKGLQILSLRSSDIQRLPKEIGQLTELQLLDLDDCSKLHMIEPGVLGSLTKLEELYMRGSFDKWDAVELTPATNARLIELNNMKKLCTLYVSIPDRSALPKDLEVEKLTKYRIQIGKANRRSRCKGSRTLELELGPTSDVLRKGYIQKILDKTNTLFLDGRDGSERSVSAFSQNGFPQLIHLQVENNPSIRYILQSPCHAVFEKLESLHLYNLFDLKKICHNHISTELFSSLRVVRVESCCKMEVLFPRSVVRELRQLEELDVRSCQLMRGIVEADDDCGELELPKLRVLGLYFLRNIKNFFATRSSRSSSTSYDQAGAQIAFFNGQQVAFPSLETLYINGMDGIEMIWDNRVAADSFPKLKSLHVNGCKTLTSLFPASIARHLMQLEELGIRDCGIVELIEKEEGAPFPRFDFPKLTSIQFVHLTELKCLYTGTHSSHWPALKTLSVDGCNKVEILASQIEDDIPHHKQPLFLIEKVAFPSLETLYINRMDSIEMICGNRLAADSFPKLKSLRVNECKILTSLFPASIARHLMQLEELKIRCCGIAKLIEKEEGVLFPRFDFPKLTSIQFQHLTKLKCLYTGTHSSHWPALQTLRVDDCNKVEILASQFEDDIPRHKQPLFLIEKAVFPNLQEFKLDLCDRMEIWHGDFHDEEFFFKLRVLKLRHLSKETAISTSRFIESLTNLEELVICESYLEERSSDVEAMEGPSHEQKVLLPFSRQIKLLKTLDVSHYDGLSSMFTPTIAENLVALTKLRISNCRILTEVLRDEEGEERREVAFSQLKCMELDALIELRCFSSGACALRFPLLEDVIVNGCPNMGVFSKGPIKAPKLEKVQARLGNMLECQHSWKENLNITIQNMFKKMAMLAGAEFVRLFEYPQLVGKWHSEHNPVDSSWKLKTLVVDKCPSFINVLPPKLMLVLDKMAFLRVHDCESLEEIFDLQGLEAVGSTRVLPRLRDLNLVNLPKLRQLWNKDLQGAMRFNSLSSLTLYKCSNLRHAFTPSMTWYLPKLAYMEIRECDQMEGVIEEEEGQGSTVEMITFPNLKSILLECLPNLTRFLSGKKHALVCTKVQYLTITYCLKMRSLTWQSSMDIEHSTPSFFTPRVLFLKLRKVVLSHMDNLSKIWPDNPLETLTFDSPWSVEVKNCKSLENLFPYWMATSLKQLKKLRVESCRIEEIVANGDDTPHSNIAQVLFPELTSLVLHDMPRLKTFCPNLPALNWPILEELRVTHCDKVNMSFAASINKWTQRNDQQNLSDQEAHSSFERDFPKLKSLFLDDKDIQMMRDGKYPDAIFGKPKALTLACFHEEDAVFPSRFLLERFQNLKSLEVFCSSFEDIFPDEGLADEGKHPALKSLGELKLSNLHKLKRVWREDYLVSKILRSIKILEVRDCPNLTILFPTVTSFQNLTELVVKNSFGLVHIGVMASLVNLSRMTIRGCERIKEVVAKDENGEGQVISFRNLRWLTLQDMPSLECFSSTTSGILSFPSLRVIRVEGCPKMKIFSKGTLSTRRNLVGRLFGHHYSSARWKGDLNRAIRELWHKQIDAQFNPHWILPPSSLQRLTPKRRKATRRFLETSSTATPEMAPPSLESS